MTCLKQCNITNWDVEVWGAKDRCWRTIWCRGLPKGKWNESGGSGRVRKIGYVPLGGPGERQFGLCCRAELHMREEMRKHEKEIRVLISRPRCAPRRFQPCQHQSFVVYSQYPSQRMSAFSRSPSPLQVILPKNTVGSSQSIFLQAYPNSYDDNGMFRHQVFG